MTNSLNVRKTWSFSFVCILKLFLRVDCRYGFLISNLFLYASGLAPIFWHLWIYAGSGNANFFYAITLVYNLGQILLLTDIVYAFLRRQFDVENPNAIGKPVLHK